MELTGGRDRGYRRTRRTVTFLAATLGGLVALVGGFSAGWVAHDQTAEARNSAERRLAVVCVLDVLIDDAEPDTRTTLWMSTRLMDECSLTETEVRKVREEP